MTTLDWLVLAVYAVLMLALSAWLGGRQRDEADYYVGGRRLPWWATGLSTLATQTSAVSVISVPAFVALAPGGGLVWLTYELALPLAMIGVAVLLLPFFRSLELVTVYEYLERRYGPSLRLATSAVFLVSRGLAAGVALYAAALVVATVLGMPLAAAIVGMGLFTLCYDVLGGIRAVIWSDVIQMAVLAAGVLLAGAIATDAVGGVGTLLEVTDPARLAVFRGADDTPSPMPFWSFFAGGLFLYLAYYGTDQSQAQRELASAGVVQTRRSLALNGFARFPLTLMYAGLGLALGAVAATQPDFAARIPADRPDALFPAFVREFLPPGARGIVIAALLAAAMSSLDSAFNSLSAATLRDFVERRRPLGPEASLRYGRLTTVLWGVVATTFAFAVPAMEGTVIESINRIGSAFYGPVLAVFVVGVVTARGDERGALIGLAAGVAVNLALWGFVPQLFWMWWNPIGFAVTALTALMVSGRVAPPGAREATLAGSGFAARWGGWRPVYTWLVVYWVVILAALWAVSALSGV